MLCLLRVVIRHAVCRLKYHLWPITLEIYFAYRTIQDFNPVQLDSSDS
jgi:hypothetical protein